MDGRRDRDECAKPIVGCGTGPAGDHVAVFSLVRFQEAEMRKALQGNNRSVGCVTGIHNAFDRLIRSYYRGLYSKSLISQMS